MTNEEILSKTDHTLLSVDATWEQIKKIIDEGIAYQTASVCIPACYVKRSAEYAAGRVPICTVIGFPSGYSTKEAKCYEALNAVKNGADEIDMVIHVGALKDRRLQDIEEEIREVKEACGDRILKVIIETCLLTDDEIVEMCSVVSESDADYIKTSTGFSTEGATFHAVELMAKNMTNGKKIKAAGGITTIDDAIKFAELGADRLGTSRLVKLIKEQ